MVHLYIKLFHRSTYATTVRDSKYAREREFLQAVSDLFAHTDVPFFLFILFLSSHYICYHIYHSLS